MLWINIYPKASSQKVKFLFFFLLHCIENGIKKILNVLIWKTFLFRHVWPESSIEKKKKKNCRHEIKRQKKTSDSNGVLRWLWSFKILTLCSQKQDFQIETLLTVKHHENMTIFKPFQIFVFFSSFFFFTFPLLSLCFLKHAFVVAEKVKRFFFFQSKLSGLSENRTFHKANFPWCSGNIITPKHHGFRMTYGFIYKKKTSLTQIKTKIQEHVKS